MLFSIAVLLILIINSLINGRYLGTVILLLPFILILLIYIRMPAKISISYNYIQYGRTIIKWEEVNKILFTVNRVGPFIKVGTKKLYLTILWRNYQNSKELRKLIEDICKIKNINYVIEDRGSL